MEYQYFDDEEKIIICFDEDTHNDMISLLELIRLDLSKSKQIKYFISIDGLESTLDSFRESCNSNSYHVYDNGRYNWLIKNLPTLCIFSKEWNDVVTFYEFAGSFNEGRMSLFFLDSNYLFDFHSLKNELFCNIQEHCFVKIEVLPDGNVFEITSCSTEYDFKYIVNWLSKRNSRKG